MNKQSTLIDDEKQHLSMSQKSFAQNHLDTQQYKLANRTHISVHQQQNVYYGVQLMAKTFEKICYRNFHNRLITNFIQSLKEEQRKIRQTKQIEIKLLKQQNWPFKQLFHKKNKNQNDLLMFQFINMCAQKIQAHFKAFITRKRHLLASKTLKKFKQNLKAITKGWRVWNIYNCKKIMDLRKTANQLNLQIDHQINHSSLQKHLKMKKIQYLNKSQQIVKQNFFNCFVQLQRSGAWIFQIQNLFKKHYKKSYKQQNPINEKQQLLLSLNLANKKPRSRQFQRKILVKQPKEINQVKKSLALQQISSFQQRPILAKGQYQIQQLKYSQNEFLKQNQYKKDSFQNQQQLSQLSGSDNLIQNKKPKEQYKSKFNKAAKYDPRKAIQQQKKKKIQLIKTKNEDKPINSQKQILSCQNIEEKIQNKHNQRNRFKTPVKNMKKVSLVLKKQTKRLDSPTQQNKQKTVQKVKKQSNLTKKDDNSKSLKVIINPKKVSSKVDCWGSKKDNSFTNQMNQQSSYKSKYLNGLRQKNQAKSTKVNLNHQIQNQQTRQTFQSTYLQKLINQREKPINERERPNFSYGNRNQEQSIVKKLLKQEKQQYPKKKLDQLKKIQQSKSFKVKNTPQAQYSTDNLSKNSIRKRQQVYRSIQSLQDVYSSQYIDRFKNLNKKLNMLQNTRQDQKDSSIPILYEQSRFMKKIYKDNTFSNLYWPQIKTMQTNFLDYIKFNINIV